MKLHFAALLLLFAVPSIWAQVSMPEGLIEDFEPDEVLSDPVADEDMFVESVPDDSLVSPDDSLLPLLFRRLSALSSPLSHPSAFITG